MKAKNRVQALVHNLKERPDLVEKWENRSQQPSHVACMLHATCEGPPSMDGGGHVQWIGIPSMDSCI